MKRLLAIGALLIAPAYAFAQEAEEGWGSSVADCLAQAEDIQELSEHEATLLCQGARSDAPVRCFREAQARTDLQKHEILSVCSPVLSSPSRGVF